MIDKKPEAAELTDDDLADVTGGTYIPLVHEFVSKNVMEDGVEEIIYKGLDYCPVCSQLKSTYFYQQSIPGYHGVNYLCLDCYNKY